MIKKILAVFLTVAGTMSITCGCGAQPEFESELEAMSATELPENTEIILTIDEPVILVNGVEKKIDDEGAVPVIIDDRTFLPVRAVVEAMGGAVEWDSGSETVTLTRKNSMVRLTIGSATAYLNGEAQMPLDAVPMILNGRTMLPIRFIAESFHFQIEWNGEKQRVIITSGAPVVAEPTTEPMVPLPVAPVQPPAAEPAVRPGAPDETQITITVNGKRFTATLEKNETAQAFYQMLPLTLDMGEMNGNEKYSYLDRSLPSDSRRIDQILAGDVMLYGASCLVSFFETFTTSYTYTPIAHINDAEGYAAALSPGRVTVVFSKE